LRSEAPRGAWAAAVNVVFIVFSGLVRGPLAFGGAGPFLYGALEAAAILAVFALVAWIERKKVGR
jgi:hypothetical protein